MQTKQRIFTWNHLRTLLLGLALLIGPLLGLAQNAQAALGWQLQTVDNAGDVGWYTSLALDSSGNPVISYRDLTNDDLKLVHCGNVTCTSGNSVQTVDSAGDVGWDTSLVLTSSGNPVISYYDNSNGDLKLVRCGNATCASGNTIVTVDSAGNVGRYTSLVLDSSGNPVISYYDNGSGDLKLVHCGNATCSSGNSIQTVDSTGNVGRFTSLVLDSSGNPVISYYDNGSGDLELVHCGNATCSSGNSVQTVDSAGNVGLHTSLVLDSVGNPVISYYDSSNLGNADLKVAHCGNATCSSGNSVQTVDSAGDVGQYTSLALNSSGNPVISYYDNINGDLKLVHCGNATCSSGNSIQTVDSAGFVGAFTSLVLDSVGNPVISYYDGADGIINGRLKLASLVDDLTPPVITPNVVGTLGSNGWYVSNVTVNWTVIDNESPISSQSGCGSTTITTDTTGTTLTCTATSAGGTTSNSVTIQRDTTAPAVFAYGADNRTTNAATISFDFFVSEDVTGVDASDFVLNASGVTGASVAVSGSGAYYQVTVNLGSGDGTLRVELVDNDSIRDLAGNPLGGVGLGNGNASGGTFTIDRTAPNTTITSQPANPSLSSAASFAFSGSDATAGVARFECKLDSAAFATCTSPQNYTALANGNHTFQVRAIDYAGNVDASPASYTWVVQIDTVMPTASPSQSPAANANGWNNSPVTVNWNWADNAGGSGIDPANCTTSSTSNGQGTLTLTATCKDLVGNTGNASTIVKVDTTAPETTITNQPANPSASGDATFIFNAADSTSGIARFECSLDSAAFANCGSPQSYNSLTNGSHTFALRAIDNAGNVDATPAAYTWVVQTDSTPPAVFAYGASNLTTNAATISFDFFVSEDVTGVDASDFVLNASGVTGASVAVRRLAGSYYFVDVNTGSGDGTLRVELVDNDSIRDLAGNPLGGVGVGNGNASGGTFTIDKTAPETTITSQPANPSTNTTASFAFSGSDATAGVARFECKLDSAAFATCTSPQNYTDLASGSHTFQVRTIDNANNVDASPASYTWSVQTDTTAPTAGPSQSPAANANGWNNSDVTVTWNWTDPSTSSGQAAGIDPANCTTSSTSSGEGTLTLTATCKDLAGNEGSASYTAKVDKTAPTITASTTNADGTPYTAPDWTNQDIIVHFTCSDDGAGIATCPADQTISAEGSLSAVQGTATDNADNSADAFAGPFQIDQTKPTIAGNRTPAANANGWNNSDVTVSFTCADNANGSTIGSDTVAGATVSTEGSNQSVTNTGACVDAAGNVADAATVSGIKIDKSAPTLNPVVSPNPVNVGGAATVSNGAADALSGIDTASCSALDTSSAGVKSVTCTATDKAGNTVNATVNYTVQVVNPGTLVGTCGGYEVRQVGSVYSAAGWSGTIKVGTNGNNTLTGTSGRDLMLGLGGNDLLNGQSGDDVLCGGDGVDLVQGLAGNDLLDGGKGNDVLNGGTGDYDQLLAGDGNDVLLDGDGVSNAAGGAGNDVFTIALRNGWRDANGQARFAGLAAGYGNDAVGLAILNPVSFFVDITGDERDNPASPLEGNNDGLALAGVIDPASTLIKFEHQVIVSADAEQNIPSEESGAEYLTEAVGGEESEATLTNWVFLPVVSNQ